MKKESIVGFVVATLLLVSSFIFLEETIAI